MDYSLLLIVIKASSLTGYVKEHEYKVKEGLVCKNSGVTTRNNSKFANNSKIDNKLNSDFIVDDDIKDFKYSESENEEVKELLDLFSEPRMAKRIFKSKNKKYIYCLGIIDYLQKYTFKKAIEHRLKKIVHGDQASAVDSTLYAFRLEKFVQTHLINN